MGGKRQPEPIQKWKGNTTCRNAYSQGDSAEIKEFVYPNHPVLTASVDTLLEKDLIRILERKLWWEVYQE